MSPLDSPDLQRLLDLRERAGAGEEWAEADVHTRAGHPATAEYLVALHNALPSLVEALAIDMSKVNRVTVVHPKRRRVYEDSTHDGVILALQDEGRTLKVLPANEGHGK